MDRRSSDGTVEQHLRIFARSPFAIGDLDAVTARVLCLRKKDLCRSTHGGIASEGQMEDPTPIEAHPQRLAGDSHGIRARETPHAPPAGGGLGARDLLIPAEDRQILTIPLIPVEVVVVRSVVPQQAPQEAVIQRPEAAGESMLLRPEVTRPIGSLALQVKGDSELADQRRTSPQPARSLLQPGKLIGKRSSDGTLADDDPRRTRVDPQTGMPPPGEERQRVVPMRGVHDVGRIVGAPRRRRTPGFGLQEEPGVWMGRTDALGEDHGKWLEVVLGEIDFPPADCTEIVRAQQLSASRLVDVPDSLRMPDAVDTRPPCSSTGSVERLAPRSAAEDGNEEIPDADEETEEPDFDYRLKPLRLALVGRPNVGKSSLFNQLLGEARSITGPEAGLTRDAIAAPWKIEDR